MNILVDINHPAHVHFFKHFIWEMQKKGHNVIITATKKDIAFNLLNEYGFSFFNLGSYGKHIMQKGFNIPIKDIQLLQIYLRHKPKIALGIASHRISHISFLLNKKSFVFDDTEHASFEIGIYKPFASKIFTPSCFTKDLGKKQVRYNGYHELAYLHPNRFTPRKEILEEHGLNEHDVFTIVRFVSWNAGHDAGCNGLNFQTKLDAIREFEKFGKVFITSESKLPPEFEKFRLALPPGKIHHFMYYASLIYGESATMSSEGAIMGVHSVYCDFAGRGYTNEEEIKYQLVFNFKLGKQDQINSIKKGIEILQNPHSRILARKKASILLKDKIDVTSFIIDQVEKTIPLCAVFAAFFL